MSAKRAPERVEELKQRLLDGMAERGIGPEVARDIYAKILAFSNYGFPESHAISFAYLVYASAWLKLYYPAAFTAALLRNQPMGFYAPHSLINDARRHGVTVLGVDVNASDALATLEGFGAADQTWADQTWAGQTWAGQTWAGQTWAGQTGPAIRLGLSAVRNLGALAAERVADGRPYRDLEDFATRTRLPAATLEALATAGAFGCFGLSRRAALWAAGAAASLREGQLPGTATGMTAPPLPAMTPAEETLADLWATSTYGTHPVAHIRAALDARQVLTAAAVRSAAADGAEVAVAGLVTHRQRPPTARGVVFLSLEDETGMVNVICPPAVWERHQPAATVAPALLVRGRIERPGPASPPSPVSPPSPAGQASPAGSAGSVSPAGPASTAVNLVAVTLRPLRVAVSATGAVASRDFR
jgi:error-prone DNA polymerase